MPRRSRSRIPPGFPEGTLASSVIVVESLVMAVLAVMFAAVWLRSREPGTWLLSIGFAVAAGW